MKNKICKCEPIAVQLRKKFNEAFELPTVKEPTQISRIRKRLQYEMMHEELDEYADSNNLVDDIDALIDMQEILFGMFAEHGLLDKWQDIYIEVHNSNMSKLDDDGKPLINGVNCERNPGKPIGKVLKSENFVEPDFKKFT